MDYKIYNHSCSCRGALSLFLALYILAAVFCVHLVHTCHSHYSPFRDFSEATVSYSERSGHNFSETVTEGICLACLFLQALHATHISVFSLAFLGIADSGAIQPYQPDPFLSAFFFSSRQVRAPPFV